MITAVAREAEEIARLYVEAWRSVQARQAALLADPTRAVARARQAELLAGIERDMRALDGAARQFAQRQLPSVYATGAAQSGAQALVFTAVDRRVVQELASGLFDNLLSATAHVDRTTRNLLRETARVAARGGVLEGKTAAEAARIMRQVGNDHGIHAVRYANGARHGLGEYATMVTRTTTAQAYNRGAAYGAIKSGTQWMECLDGPDCGWTTHDDPEPAMGKVVSPQEALDYPTAHPNCRRAFAPRPDIVDPDEAEPLVSEDQLAAQEAQDVQLMGRRAPTEERFAERRQQREDRLERRAERLSTVP